MQPSFQSFHYWINIIMRCQNRSICRQGWGAPGSTQPPPNLSTSLTHSCTYMRPMRSRFVHISTSLPQAKLEQVGGKRGYVCHSIPSYWFLCIIHTGPLKYKWICFAEALKDWSPMNSSALSPSCLVRFFSKEPRVRILMEDCVGSYCWSRSHQFWIETKESSKESFIG